MTSQTVKSLADLDQILRQNPNDAWALAHRGELYRLNACYAEALRDFSCALALKPDYLWARARRGETFGLLGQYTQALNDFNQAIASNFSYSWALAHRGVVYRWLRRYPEALADLSKALALKPDYGWALIHRGNLYIKSRRYQEAVADFERAAALDPTLVSHWRGEYGLLLIYLGRYAEAIATCEYELQTSPDDYIAFYTLVIAQFLGSGPAHVQPNIARLHKLLQCKLEHNEEKKLQAGILYRLAGLHALQNDQAHAFDYLQAAVLLDDEPKEIARHDPVWAEFRNDARFRTMVDEEFSSFS